MQLDSSSRAIPTTAYPVGIPPDERRLYGLNMTIWKYINGYASNDSLESDVLPPIQDITRTQAQEALSLPELLVNRVDVISYLFMIAQGKVSNMVKQSSEEAEDVGTLCQLLGCLQLCTQATNPFALSQSVFTLICNSFQTLTVDCSQCNSSQMSAAVAKFPQIQQIILRYSSPITTTLTFGRNDWDSSDEDSEDFAVFQGGVLALLRERKIVRLFNASDPNSKRACIQWRDIKESYIEIKIKSSKK